jgi:hypothetical protein
MVPTDIFLIGMQISIIPGAKKNYSENDMKNSNLANFRGEVNSVQGLVPVI